MGQRCEDRPDPRYARGRRAQHCHADRCAVDVPQHEPVTHPLRVVDEPYASAVVARMTERLDDEPLHPIHKQAVLVVGGEPLRTRDLLGST